jgi:hypothetical protein
VGRNAQHRRHAGRRRYAGGVPPGEGPPTDAACAHGCRAHLELRRLDPAGWLVYLVDVRSQEGPSPIEFDTYELAVQFADELALQAFGQVANTPTVDVPAGANGLTLHLLDWLAA